MIEGARVNIRTTSGAIYLGTLIENNGTHVVVDTGHGRYIVAWSIIVEVRVL